MAELAETAHDLHQLTHEKESVEPEPVEISSADCRECVAQPARPLMHHQHRLLRISNEELRAAAE
jgi:hypothetical protein